MESNKNILALYKELNWLELVIDQVIRSYLQQEGHENNWLDIPLPAIEDNDSYYARFVVERDLNTYDRLALAITIAPHIRPEILDIFFGKNQMYDRGFTEFGGVIDKNHCGFLPTGQTFNFLVTATAPELRIDVMNALGNESKLIQEQVIKIGNTESHIPFFNGSLSMSNQWLNYFITGEEAVMALGAEFPAKQIHTKLEWKDAVLSNLVMDQLEEIVTWIKNDATIMTDWGLDKMIKPGYRALFYGPPGTGKTLTASLLGKATGKDVYKVDLSMIVSKYIGETEKNLARVFDNAKNKNWILFFDEADALFGKRTAANSSNDRSANQQVSYLLQKIEDFPGVVILASNLKANMDDAFTRRFQAMINFPIPSAEERLNLWTNAFSEGFGIKDDVNLQSIAEDYELAGGAIINVLRTSALKAVQRKDTSVGNADLLDAIKREFKKENKTLPLKNLN